MLRLLMVVLLAGVCRGEEWTLAWEEDFSQIDPDRWQHEVTAWGGGNNEFQIYTDDPANSYVRDGVLYLKPTLTMVNVNPRTGKPFGEAFLYNGTLDLIGMYGYCTNSDNYGCYRQGMYGLIPPVMSANIRTSKRFSYRYGKMEIMAKMPVGDWIWPAMWLLPEDDVYGSWPRSGEIDIVELIGNRDLNSTSTGDYIGVQQIGSTLHWGTAWNENKYYLTHGSRMDIDDNYGDHFHNYTLVWNETQMTIGVDGADVLVVPRDDQLASWQGFWEYGIEDGGGWGTAENPWVNGTSMAPFDQDFYIILNVAVGGTNGFFPDNVVNGFGPKPWNNSDPNAIDKFWAAHNEWYATWLSEGENNAMQVESIKVWQLEEQITPTGKPTAAPTGPPCLGGSSTSTALTWIYLFLAVVTKWLSK